MADCKCNIQSWTDGGTDETYIILIDDSSNYVFMVNTKYWMQKQIIFAQRLKRSIGYQILRNCLRRYRRNQLIVIINNFVTHICTAWISWNHEIHDQNLVYDWSGAIGNNILKSCRHTKKRFWLEVRSRILCA